MIKTYTPNPLNKYEYLGQKTNDRKPKYETKPIEVKPILAKELLPLLEKSNAYGLDKFKSLIKF
mgnify:CR=1 FL=1